MSKRITIEIPPWLSEEEFMKIIRKILNELEGRVSIDELRKELGIKTEDLVEDLETYDVENLEAKEKERL